MNNFPSMPETGSKLSGVSQHQISTKTERMVVNLQINFI